MENKFAGELLLCFTFNGKLKVQFVQKANIPFFQHLLTNLLHITLEVKNTGSTVDGQK